MRKASVQSLTSRIKAASRWRISILSTIEARSPLASAKPAPRGLAAVGAVLVGLWLALSPAGVMAQETPPGFVWYVVDELNRASFDTEDPTNRPIPLTEPPAGVLMPVDVSRDGVADWLIRWPEDHRSCGAGGCRLSLYVSEGNRYLRVFDRQAWDPDIRTVGDEVRLEASFHHLNCLPPRDVCRLAWA